MKIYPVILSGGAGTRLWPLSRAVLPKQLLPIVADKTMLQDTALRVAGLPGLMAPLVVCGNDHRFMVAEQLREAGITPLGILLEPVGRNTAPAVAAAAHFLKAIDPEAVMLVLPADHVIADTEAFREAVARAAHAGAGRRPRHLRHRAAGAGNRLRLHPPRRGAAATARRLLQGRALRRKAGPGHRRSLRGRRRLLLEQRHVHVPRRALPGELARFAPEIAARRRERPSPPATATSISAASTKRRSRAARRTRSTTRSWSTPTTPWWCRPTSAGATSARWSALWEVQQHDENGNARRGDVYLDGVKNSLVRAESRIVAVVGVEDIVVVETHDAVLVAHKSAGPARQAGGRPPEVEGAHRAPAPHASVYRPWGHYEGIDAGDRFQVKRITVKPGEKLSLQMHHHRAEHWVVVSGTARVTCGDKISLLSENESTYIPIGMNHRLENPGKLPLHIIEVQSGSYLGEDDIVRFEDIYKRS